MYYFGEERFFWKVAIMNMQMMTVHTVMDGNSGGSTLFDGKRNRTNIKMSS